MELSLEDAIIKKRENPNLLLIVSIEGNRTMGDFFWTSPKVQEILQNNSETIITYRIIIEEIPSDYCDFNSLYKVDDIPSLFIFEPNEQEDVVSQKWVGKIPSPEQFSLYMLEGVVEEEPVHHPNEKKTVITVIASERRYSEEFYISDSVCVLYNWLNAEFGPHHSYTLAKTNEPLTKDVLLTFRQAGMYPEVELIMHYENYGSMTLKNNHFVDQTQRDGIFTKVYKKLKCLLYFVIPCAKEYESDDEFWEYQPQPDIAKSIVQTLF